MSKNKQVYLKEADLSSFQSIKSFCDNFRIEFKKLDILIHNAAYFNHGEKFKLSPDNIELTFATNVFGPFFMTTLLLDHFKKSDDARILHASSNIIKHFFNPDKQISFDTLYSEENGKKPHSVYTKYCDSKMALTMLTFKMAEEYKKTGLKINALQINGAKMSKETIKKFKPIWRQIAHIQNLYFSPPEFMADRYIEICTSGNFKNVTGQIINHNLKIMEPSEPNPGIVESFKQLFGSDVYPRYANRKDVTEKIWNLCNDITQKHCK